MDIKSYSPDWRDIVRPQILKRDNYKCVRCGVRHKAKVYLDSSKNYIEVDNFTEQWAIARGFKVQTIYLNVCHLDHNKENNDPSNLVSMCPRDHSKMDAEHKKMMRLTYQNKTKGLRSLKSANPFDVESKLVLQLKALIKNFTGVTLDKTQLISVIDLVKKID